ncbi:MAG: serine/threonine-protein kinase PknK [Deinococcales bacterium]
MSTLSNQRYQFMRELGAGAMGQVSLAMDTQTNTLVAIKKMHEMVALSGGARMRREFRSLSQIAHPNVVRVLELGEERGVPFLVMEFVRGQDLSEWLLGKPDFEQIAKMFAGIADALGAVHARGVIHRDLKPENIRVTTEGEPKLMDFGLAKTLEGTVALTKAGAMVGTALYMSPEQCRGAQLDYRADLYSLGAVLYWALTGQPPFIGESIVQVVLQHIQQAPTPPRERNPNVPEALENICLALLAKNPNDRPSSAEAVREALLRSLEVQSGRTIELESVAARADALLLAPLIGRESELETLVALFESGLTGLYVVTGDVGTGKTKLLRTLAERAQLSGARLGIGEAIADDPTPFGAVKRLIENLEKYYRFVFEELSPNSKFELARIAPQFGVALPSDPNMPAEVARLRLFEAFTELLERISSLTVVAFENLHWADESTLAMLAHALRAAPEARVIATYRIEDLPEGQHAPKGFPKSRKTLALGALTDEQMSELLRALLGGEIEPALEQELVSHAGGNPWVLEERLKAMLENGAIRRRAQVFEWDRSLTGVPESLGELLAHRLAVLDPNVLEFARAASVLGRVFWFEDARAMLEWRDDDALDALESLSRARLVAEIPASNGEGFRFTHPLYSELLRAGIMRLKRKRLHAKAAALRAGKAEALELAEHCFAAEDYAKALELAVQAGREAQAAFAYPQAERAYRLALESGMHLEVENSASEVQQLLLVQTKYHLAVVLEFTGRIPEAQNLRRDVIDHAQWLPRSAELIAKAKVDLVRAMRFSGETQNALELIGVPKPSEPLYSLLCVELSALLRQKNPAQARRYALDAVKSAKHNQNPEDLVRAITVLALVTTQPQRKLSLGRIATKIAEYTDNNHVRSTAWNDLGVAYYNTNFRKEAFEAWSKAAKYAEVVGNMRNLVGLEINKALILMQDSDFDEAQANLERTLTLARRFGLQTIEKYALFNHALCLYAQNRLSDAREEFQMVRDHPRELVARVWETRITIELGDGFVLEVPEIEADAVGYGYYLLTKALLALSFGDYQKAWEQTAQPIHDSDWHWALVRVHAAWRLGLHDAVALQKLLEGKAEDPSLSDQLVRSYAEFIELVLSDWTAEVRQKLRQLAQQYQSSPIGVLARDVALSLSED